jgi:hypothetical protein
MLWAMTIAVGVNRMPQCPNGPGARAASGSTRARHDGRQGQKRVQCPDRPRHQCRGSAPPPTRHPGPGPQRAEQASQAADAKRQQHAHAAPRCRHWPPVSAPGSGCRSCGATIKQQAADNAALQNGCPDHGRSRRGTGTHRHVQRTRPVPACPGRAPD